MVRLDEIEGAIFDMDGTLLDSMNMWKNVGSSYVRMKGKVPEADLDEIIKDMSFLESARYIKVHYQFEEDIEAMMDEVNQMVKENYQGKIQEKPFVKEFLERLRDKGVPMCVATATDESLVKACLKRLGLLEYFKEIFTCRNVGAGKEQPDIYEAALQRLGTLKEKTFVFEDVLHAVKTAKQAGFPVAALYDESSREDWKEIMGLADISAVSMGEFI
ncbi:HAD family hydrolase [uncultured Robinsoniella sp.]|uniref:HAD family hydrolase n=1 Tax=uncultured Robinsoniella sp. TaxID=904190 RepID=UPI00374E46ED